MAQKRYRDAVSFYRKANAKGMNRVLVMAEYRAGVLAGDAQADNVLQDWVAAHPDDTAAAIILADARQRGGDVDGAIGLYEQALAKVPGNAVLLNNLAVLYQAKGNPKALELAEQAYKAAPKSAAVQDTYGWILFLGGKTDEAARLLAEAIKGMPDAAEVQYHYAAALTKQGRTAEAIPLLKKAMSGQLPAATKADAQKLLQQLSK
jgi:tetratricopeptide (TPR) repeat protein